MYAQCQRQRLGPVAEVGNCTSFLFNSATPPPNNKLTLPLPHTFISGGATGYPEDCPAGTSVRGLCFRPRLCIYSVAARHWSKQTLIYDVALKQYYTFSSVGHIDAKGIVESMVDPLVVTRVSIGLLGCAANCAVSPTRPQC